MNDIGQNKPCLSISVESGVIYGVLIYLVFFARFLKSCFSYLSNDLGFHLRIGQDIWSNKDIHQINHYNFDFLNIPWVNHEWLFDVIVYLIYHHAGYITLAFFFAIIPVLSLWQLTKITMLVKANEIDNKPEIQIKTYYFIIAYLGFYASLPQMGITMKEVTILFVVVLILVLYRFGTRETPKTLYGLPILFYAWANLHGSFLIGFFILAVWFLLKLTVRYVPQNFIGKTYFDPGRSYEKRDFVFFIFWSIASFAVTLLTPYGYDLYGLLSSYLDAYYPKHIYEWQPFYYYPIDIKQLLYMLLYLMLFISSLIGALRNPERATKSSLPLFVLSVAFLFLSLKSKRHFPLFMITSLPLMTWWLLENSKMSATRFSYLFSKPAVKYVLVAVLLIYSVQLLATTRFMLEPFRSYCEQYPYKAVAYMKSNPNFVDKKLFNVMHWGGYLMWMWPEKKIFIDGRFLQVKMNDHTLLEEYYQFFDKKSIHTKLREYRVDAVLLCKETNHAPNWFQQTFAHLSALENDRFSAMGNSLKLAKPEWKIDYEDETSIVFVR